MTTIITLIGILLGVYSGENLTNDFINLIDKIEILRPYSSQIATGLIVLFITYLSIVLGELLPKRIGMTFPEPIISVLAKPMRMISIITSPFVWLLTFSNNLILNILGFLISINFVRSDLKSKFLSFAEYLGHVY